MSVQWELKPYRNCIVCLLVCLFVVGKVVKIYSLIYEKSNIKIGDNKEHMINYCVLVVERALAQAVAWQVTIPASPTCKKQHQRGHMITRGSAEPEL